MDIDQNAFKVIYKISAGDMRQAINLLEAVAMRNQGNNEKISTRSIYECAARPDPEQISLLLQPMTFMERNHLV